MIADEIEIRQEIPSGNKHRAIELLTSWTHPNGGRVMTDESAKAIIKKLWDEGFIVR